MPAPGSRTSASPARQPLSSGSPITRDQRLLGAVQSSPLAAASPVAQSRLLSTAQVLQLDDDRELRRDEVHLVVTGRLAMRWDEPDGRSIAVAYLDRGALAGVTAFLGSQLPVRIAAVGPAITLRLSNELLEHIVDGEARLARALGRECARQSDAVLDLTRLALFPEHRLQQRIARHLLELSHHGHRPVRVEELARAVGVWRETVSRQLGLLRTQHLVEAKLVGNEVVDAKRLGEIAWPTDEESSPRRARDRDHTRAVTRVTRRP